MFFVLVFVVMMFAAIVLMAIWRPSPHGRSLHDLVLVAVFGLVLACMNLSFYASLDRIPLGAAVTFEFVGQTESSQQVEIRARVNGFLEKRVYAEGTFVKPG